MKLRLSSAFITRIILTVATITGLGIFQVAAIQASVSDAPDYKGVVTGDPDHTFAGAVTIAADSQNNIYFARANTVRKFDQYDNFVASWSLPGGFPSPEIYSIAVDSDDQVYVATSRNKVHKFNSVGEQLVEWGSGGSGNGQFSIPVGLAIDSQDRVIVSEMGNSRIQIFDSQGNYVTKWSAGGSVLPFTIAVDAEDRIYVADAGTDQIHQFSQAGDLLQTWASNGADDGQFDNLSEMVFDNEGYLYAVDRGGDRVQKLDSEGQFVTKWGTSGSGEGQFLDPVGITMAANGRIYVTDAQIGRIQYYSYPQPEPTPTPLPTPLPSPTPTPVQSGPSLNLNGLTAGGSSLRPNATGGYSTASIRPTFSGTATPHSTVIVEIHSDPIILTTTADGDGNWSVTPDQDLPPGEHTVYISATLNGETTELDSFVLAVQQTVPNTGAEWLAVRGVGLGLVIVGGCFVIGYRRGLKDLASHSVPRLFP